MIQKTPEVPYLMRPVVQIEIPEGEDPELFPEYESVYWLVKWPNGSYSAGSCANCIRDLFWSLDEEGNPHQFSDLWVQGIDDEEEQCVDTQRSPYFNEENTPFTEPGTAPYMENNPSFPS